MTKETLSGFFAPALSVVIELSTDSSAAAEPWIVSSIEHSSKHSMPCADLDDAIYCAKRQAIAMLGKHGLDAPKDEPLHDYSAPAFLEAGAKHMRDRASLRDAPDGERSMAKTVAAFNALYGKRLTEEEGWMFMVLLKQARASQGKFVPDDYEDGAAYFGLAGEAAARERAGE